MIITQMDKKRKMTQCEKILLYLERNGGATVRDIFIDCNINSPTKRLSELRKDGLITEQKWEGENFKRYYLRGTS